MMLALKIPLIGLIAIVWWAVKQKPEDDAKEGVATAQGLATHGALNVTNQSR